MYEITQFKVALRKLFVEFRLFGYNPPGSNPPEILQQMNARRRYLLLAAAVEVILTRIGDDLFDSLETRQRGFQGLQALAASALVLAKEKLTQAAKSLR